MWSWVLLGVVELRSGERQLSVRNSRLRLFFEFFFERRERTRRRTQRFTIVVQRKPGDVDAERARRRLLVDDDRDRAAFDAVAERQAAAASETRVWEPLQHLTSLYPI